jgi:hypothetical protein
MLVINWWLALIAGGYPGVEVITQFRKNILVEFRNAAVNSKITGTYNENITGVASGRWAGCREFEGAALTDEMYRQLLGGLPGAVPPTADHFGGGAGALATAVSG